MLRPKHGSTQPFWRFGRRHIPLARWRTMTRETAYIVQAFHTGKGNRLKADTAIPCKSADVALRTAERLALTKLGVVAFASSGDQELGEYDDAPVILFKSGQLP